MTSSPTKRCSRCDHPHDLIQCPYVKAIEYFPNNGGISRVEFLTPADLPATPPKETKVDVPADAYPRKGSA